MSVFLPSFLSSLPEHIVVPASLADQDLKQYSSFYNDGRIPVSTKDLTADQLLILLCMMFRS